ncbi:sensor histidine kinase regulating citrate/malate metabolism [Alkalihalobacillus xiaoxiensis]|uniref:histidine kinase n=1 Tax=Shouchella xiaoxiensis TaxID=766895 RepID=A0ABS2SXG0_9BACI|nr:sensor histidine kinase [Shouchella xiaoxiensis]MBM7839711.1 sensor histidine kinase regulating citrate/malate metabolism [Shouchella xiaoxiensis]
MKQPLSLRTQTMLLSGGIVLVSLILFGLFSAYQQVTFTREHLADKVQISASHLKDHPLVTSALEAGSTSEELIEFVQDIRIENQFRYIVVMDTNQIRYTHPVADRIGKHFVGDDADLVFEGESYISEAVGFLGPSVRAFEPVYNDEGAIIGAVSVGIATDAIAIAENKVIITSAIGAGISLLVGLVGAFYLANRIKSRLLGLEPQEIARFVNEREAILEAAGEGIIAINDTGNVIAANESALTFLQASGKEEAIEGKLISDVWPDLKLECIVTKRESQFDRVYHLGELEAVVTKVPIFYNRKCIGALATFREKKQLDDIMKRLSGAETYARSLRSETHEFMNKLHIISAMVETESYAELREYIGKLSERYQQKKNKQLPDEVAKLVSDVSLAQFLARKTEALEEQGITVLFQSGTMWPKLDPELIDAWITIMGNTIDNAVEASQSHENHFMIITIKQVGGVLRYVIEDNGKGFTPKQEQEGWMSTKAGDHGYGLENVRKEVDKYNGTFDVLSRVCKGTIVTIHIPLGLEGSVNE